MQTKEILVMLSHRHRVIRLESDSRLAARRDNIPWSPFRLQVDIEKAYEELAYLRGNDDLVQAMLDQEPVVVKEDLEDLIAALCDEIEFLQNNGGDPVEIALLQDLKQAYQDELDYICSME